MIIHRLIAHHLKHRDDGHFYYLQAADAIAWLRGRGVRVGDGVRALDLGCGHGIFGRELARLGCQVTYSDESNQLLPELHGAEFKPLNLDRESVAVLGSYDLVICSNVLEHLAQPAAFLASMQTLLAPGGHLYLSWTNWLSPWGGHEFSPFHYLGPRWGVRAYDRLVGRPRKHTPYVNLFPTHIGTMLRLVRQTGGLRVVAAVPRYYPELGFLMAVPGLREFLAWNCALLIQRPAA